MFDNLTNDNLLDQMLTDKTLHQYTWRKYQTNMTEEDRWRKWLMS